jgi:flagellar biosynthesis/type III secretory pathway protein FliH
MDQTERMRLEVEHRVEEAHAAGYDAGRLDGELAEAARFRNTVAAAETALDTIRASEIKWQECVVENIAALAVTLARHIVGRELHADAASVAELVKRALAEFPIDQPMRVRVNPHDLSLLSLPTPDGGEPVSIAPNRDVRWLADARIQPGGCVVEGRERIVDGRVDTALERLYRKLTDNVA